jgi:hypothetical protein
LQTRVESTTSFARSAGCGDQLIKNSTSSKVSATPGRTSIQKGRSSAKKKATSSTSSSRPKSRRVTESTRLRTCIACGARTIVRKSVAVVLANGKNVPGVEVDVCSNCGEHYYDLEAMRMLQQYWTKKAPKNGFTSNQEPLDLRLGFTRPSRGSGSLRLMTSSHRGHGGPSPAGVHCPCPTR